MAQPMSLCSGTGVFESQAFSVTRLDQFTCSHECALLFSFEIATPAPSPPSVASCLSFPRRALIDTNSVLGFQPMIGGASLTRIVRFRDIVDLNGTLVDATE